MKQTFEEADKNGDGLLNIDEIYQLLHKLNVNLPRRKVKQMFQVRNENLSNLFSVKSGVCYFAVMFLCVMFNEQMAPNWRRNTDI